MRRRTPLIKTQKKISAAALLRRIQRRMDQYDAEAVRARFDARAHDTRTALYRKEMARAEWARARAHALYCLMDELETAHILGRLK